MDTWPVYSNMHIQAAGNKHVYFMMLDAYYFLRHSLARSILNSGKLTKPSAFSSWRERERWDEEKDSEMVREQEKVIYKDTRS